MSRARDLADSADKDFAGTVTVDNLVIDTNARFASGATVTTILDEDNMSSNSATALSTQQAVKQYVDTQVATIPTGDITSVVAGTGLSGGGTSGDVTVNIDNTVATLSGTQTLTNKSIDATQLTGTVADARFPATLPAASGVNLTALNASNLSSGTLPDARFPAALPAVSGANLTNLPASGIASVAADTTPQLGGNLDVQTHSLVSTSNRDISITPNGTGNVALGNFVFNADQTVGAGQDNFLLTYDHSATSISLETAPAGGAGYFEGENGATGDTTNGKGDIFRVHEAQLDTNTTLPASTNSLCAGPLTLDATLTINGTLTIV